jgi:hypothetical protein
MKHASAATLLVLAPLLAAVRRHPALVERKPGIFYLRGRACLHFHEDPGGLHADLRVGQGDFERHRVDSAEERAVFVARLAQHLAEGRP